MNFGLDLTDEIVNPLEILMMLDQLGIPFQEMNGQSFPREIRRSQVSSFFQSLGNPSRNDQQSDAQHPNEGHPSMGGSSGGTTSSEESGGNQNYQVPKRGGIRSRKKPVHVYGSMVFKDFQ